VDAVDLAELAKREHIVQVYTEPRYRNCLFLILIEFVVVGGGTIGKPLSRSIESCCLGQYLLVVNHTFRSEQDLIETALPNVRRNVLAVLRPKISEVHMRI